MTTDAPLDDAPLDDAFAARVQEQPSGAPLSLYVHVPYCAQRCTYCDFVTYVPGDADHRDPARWLADATAELDVAARVLASRAPRIDTVYFGGGTPTLLPPEDLVAFVDRIRDRFELAGDAEITTEANPDSVTPATLGALVDGGFGRISFGMQSAAPHVLAALGRVHASERPPAAVAEARAAGFAHVGLDLISGGPGETDDDWQRSLDAVVGSGCDHVSAYGLIVEPRTPLARAVASGELGVADDDTVARRYRIADRVFGGAGFAWYEISNWATSPDARCRHNLGYWANGDWWGIGPGAHSHVAGHRWWNHANPGRWAAAAAAGEIPASGSEALDADQRRLERLMLGIRTDTGLPLDGFDAATADTLAADGLLDGVHLARGRLVLTLEGRLLANLVIARLS